MARRVGRRILKGNGNDLADLEESLSRIEDWMTVHLLPDAKGVAIFVRGRYALLCPKICRES